MARDEVICIGFIGFCKGALSTVNTVLSDDCFLSGGEENCPEVAPVQVHFAPDGNTIYLFIDATTSYGLPPDTGTEASGNGSSVVDGSSFQLHQRLLWAFYVCHVVVFVHRGHSFDFGNLRLLRSLQLGRQQLTHVVKAAVGAGLSSSYSAPGQVLPVLGFLFLVAEDAAETLSQLETQIRVLLRRSQLTGLDSTRSPLCSLDPANVCFVVQEAPDPRRSLPGFGALLLDGLFSGARSAAPEPDGAGVQRVRDFLERQAAFFRRQSAKLGPRYDLPTAEGWQREMAVLDRIVHTGQADADEATASQAEPPAVPQLERMRASLSALGRFSHIRCSHGHSAAKAQYVAALSAVDAEDLEAAHRELLGSALDTFLSVALGEHCATFQAHLLRDCEALFEHRRGQAHREAAAVDERRAAPRRAAARRRTAAAAPAAGEAEGEADYLFDTLPAHLYCRQPAPEAQAPVGSPDSDSLSDTGSQDAVDVESVGADDADAKAGPPVDGDAQPATHPFGRGPPLCHCGRSPLPAGSYSLLGPECCGAAHLDVPLRLAAGAAPGDGGPLPGLGLPAPPAAEAGPDGRDGPGHPCVLTLCSLGPDVSADGPPVWGSERLRPLTLTLVSPNAPGGWSVPLEAKAVGRPKGATGRKDAAKDGAVSPVRVERPLLLVEAAEQVCLQRWLRPPQMGSPAKPPSGASAGEVDGAGREADRARRRRRPPPAEAAPEPAGEAGEASPSSFTFLLGFEYENASDGARWMAEPAEVLLARSTLDDWPGVPLFAPERKVGGRTEPRGGGGGGGGGAGPPLRAAVLHRVYVAAPPAAALFTLRPAIQYYDPLRYSSGPAGLEARLAGPVAPGLVEHLVPEAAVVLPPGHAVVLRLPYVFPGVDYTYMRLDELSYYRLSPDLLRLSGP